MLPTGLSPNPLRGTASSSSSSSSGMYGSSSMPQQRGLGSSLMSGLRSPNPLSSGITSHGPASRLLTQQQYHQHQQHQQGTGFGGGTTHPHRDTGIHHQNTSSSTSSSSSSHRGPGIAVTPRSTQGMFAGVSRRGGGSSMLGARLTVESQANIMPSPSPARSRMGGLFG